MTIKQPVLRISDYEAPQCCTMRYAEALLCFSQNKELFSYDPLAPTVTESDGRQFLDDRLLVMTYGKVVPIFSGNRVARAELEALELKVLF